ncbi:MAG: polysaccharide deacetylase family protein [Bacteroidales bacterium]|nr:polysaccharide deacetylase family protein [Bacteroidales bacterium]MBN2762828.1 polysaccharide deacetylase family protein [Bacteroidales bacterium]
MKAPCIIFSILYLFSLSIYSQQVQDPYEVGIWPGFRTAAINYTFDDGCSNQFKTAIPLFDEFGFNLTLFTVTNWVGNWAALESAAANGHEVASHTVTHADFRNITLEQQETELKNSREIIESHIPDNKCITMAYPYCATGADTICSKYYLSARGCQGFVEPKTPGSYFNISSVICGNLGDINTLQDFKLRFTDAANKNGWCVFLIHGIDDDGGYSPITSGELRRSVEYLSVRKSKFWVTTFASATLYSRERDAVNVIETMVTDSSMTLQVTDTLPDLVYNFPLTLRCPLPADWPSANVTQDSVTVPKRIVLVDTTVYLNFDVVPDAGNVIISKNLTPVTPEADTIPGDDVDPPSDIRQTSINNSAIQAVYDKGTLIIALNDIISSNLMIYIYDTRGIMLMSKKQKSSGDNTISIAIASDNLCNGVYYVYLSDGKNTWSQKFLVI